MVSSIGSSMGSMFRPDPAELFKKVDSDSSSGISQKELQTFAEDISSLGGTALDAGEEAFAGYDTDSDGSLSADELDSLLTSSNGGAPPGGPGGGPPPPPPPEQAAASYSENSGEDALASLVSSLTSLLEKLSSSGSNSEESDGGSTVSGMQRPDPKDFFATVDSDSSGGISQDELTALVEDMKNTTGASFDTSDEAFAGYDRDSDGSLSMDELKTVMDSNRPQMAQGPGGMQGPPPPPPGEEQSASTDDSSLEEQIAMVQDLLNILTKSNSDTTAGSSSLLSITT